MENLIQLERFWFMKFDYDYKIDLWLDIKYCAMRIATAPLCIMGKHKFKEYNPRVDICNRCNLYKINKKRRVN
jgi:hypothetical protein